MNVRVRYQIVGHACIKNVGKSQSFMVSKLQIIYMETDRMCDVSLPDAYFCTCLQATCASPEIDLFDSAAYLLTSCLGPCMYGRVYNSSAILNHARLIFTLHNECAHVELSDLYTHP